MIAYICDHCRKIHAGTYSPHFCNYRCAEAEAIQKKVWIQGCYVCGGSHRAGACPLNVRGIR